MARMRWTMFRPRCTWHSPMSPWIDFTHRAHDGLTHSCEVPVSSSFSLNSRSTREQ